MISPFREKETHSLVVKQSSKWAVVYFRMASAKPISQSESWGAHREAKIYELRRECSLVILPM